MSLKLSENEDKKLVLTACDEGDPSATESTQRKAFSFFDISENHITHRINYLFCWYGGLN